MVAYRRILVPTDFSDTSRFAVSRACGLARRFEAEIHLVNVLPLLDLGPVTTDMPAVSRMDLEEKWVRAARDELDALARESRVTVRVTSEVTRGHPFVEIVRYARAHRIDLIVMGTHGRGAVEHMLLGSVAEKVVRKAPCPVLTVRLPEHSFRLPGSEEAHDSRAGAPAPATAPLGMGDATMTLRRILFPTDFSDTADYARGHARELAGRFQASLHLLHVVADPLSQDWAGGVATRAEERLGELSFGGIDVERTTRAGHVFVEIVRYAADKQIDLIVMGTHGHGPVAHLLLGSVADKVVRKAPCPVLTVRKPGHAFVMPVMPVT